MPDRVESTQKPQAMLRFGAFELDLRAQELRKSGVRLHLAKQPFLILSLLAERPGTVITRHELRNILWDENTHVDFDRCLNTAVNRLREVLNDSAETPRFIETLPRQGYRLLVPVERSVKPVSEEPAREPVPAERSLEQDAEATALEPVPASAFPSWKTYFRASWMLAFLVAGAALVGGVWLAFRGDRSVPLGQPALTTMVDDGTALTPSLSPDGKRIAFAWRPAGRPDYDIYMQEIGGGKPKQVSAGPTGDFSPSFSADGLHIAFYRRAGDGIALYASSVDEGRLRRLGGLNVGPPATTFDEGETVSVEPVSWHPNGKYLAYVDRVSPAHPASIFQLSMESRAQEQVTFSVANERDGFPVFSPDGRWLAFARSGGKGDEIWLLPLPGGDLRRVVSENAPIHGLAWTGNSRSIVFSSNRAGQSQLWTIPLAGGNAQRVEQVREPAILPSLASGAAGLAFVRLRQQPKVHLLTLGGAAQPKMLDILPDPAGISNVRFSPDGTRIAFSADIQGHREIWVSDSDGGHPRSLTSLGVISGSPHWSPDGKWLAFDSQARGNWDVYVISGEGGQPMRLTTHTGDDVRPSWSADGSSIYFGSDRSGTMQIWSIPSAGGTPRQLTTKGGYEAAESSGMPCLFYIRKGVTGLWRACRDGAEQAVIENLPWKHSRNWVVTSSGVYFLARQGTETMERSSILKLLRFPSFDSVEVSSLGKARIEDSGISLAAGGKRLAYVQRKYSGAAIVIVPGYR